MASSPKPPKPIDPNTLINAQQKANDVDRITPFGSQTYGTGPDGQKTFTTSLSPQMQGLMDRGMGLAGTQLTPLSNPQGFDGLQSALMNKVQSHYASPSASPQGAQKAQQQQLPPITGGGPQQNQSLLPYFSTALNGLYSQAQQRPPNG